MLVNLEPSFQNLLGENHQHLFQDQPTLKFFENQYVLVMVIEQYIHQYYHHYLIGLLYQEVHFH